MGRRITQSLAARLIGAVALAQVFVLMGGMAAWMLTSPFVTWEDVGAESASGLVLEAVGRDEAGRPAVLPTAALARYAARRPDLGFAVLLGGQVLPGGSPALTEALALLGPNLPREGRLAMPVPGGLALFRVAETPLGEAVVVTAGNRFFADEDLGAFVTVFLLQLIPIFGPALLAMVLALPLAIRHTLRPLRRMAREAAAIDLHSLDRRLDGGGSPAELQPFIAAMNEILERLEEGVRQQRVFTANAAHELRTPVAILHARLESLDEALPERGALLRDIGRITILLDQMLAIARLGQRETRADEVVELAACARAVVADMAPMAIRARRGLALEVQADPLVRGNARALEGALANLIENALRAEPEGGTVLVTVGPGGRLAVSDHGAGVAREDRPFLFEPFWRKDERTPGTGLGLAIVREVARLHGGSAAVEETPGGGATFFLALPALRQPAAISG
ncbi:HAMP domain-containing sensor histidine kinase [Sediminicoccus sp. KRV36]|uniref:sensor histidine kinase n=1 Tax=Sediminicoccus sp. KRV36 TaxID=3133721 RepID=UPI00200C49CC|nr:HAMP domain-containing sensor histidine kinase [Sediminicoccus rosea]UPY37924.1 HAMP domain-containing histidine kinase [Sediminicoccus rosea]